MRKLRLFWAINLPENLKEHFFQIQLQLKTSRADAKWVEKENLHLTMQFLGDVETWRVNGLISAATGVLCGRGAFSVQMGGLGFFPHIRRPRVLWMGVREGADRLQFLYAALGSAMATQGFPPGGQAFSPHLTLARLRSDRGVAELIDKVRSLAGLPAITCPVTSVDLMSSQLYRTGPVYTPLAHISLGRSSKV
ncbi:RNA 2',3'-cyclic phosphodiesterase [Desulfofundulus thermobenzoicus]|uniref:RNA 2',3'-cyclic phosphodiesterase n=1 Tax=Desulfofundulus thermobenzoicus TaxID=29376 RepID=A0A6N7IMN3_9FIRM|nr:RNA 2',3'-cyclic phosphodiesterase [Desulfofundulus thermobenzoicus]MQL51211.1 RNA 2',3'-cyclic phosphodiesterase [Desulfofundulus thermobenzoicus]HHW43660.1 RNA 2',3'-cyclic phosphodiesterase [Desulfotomaculum sp.]